MIIDLSCPIELRSYEIMHDDTGASRAYIDLFNLSDETIKGYSATVRWSCDETQQGFNDYVSVDNIAIPGGALFKLALSMKSPLRYADRIEIYFNDVSFENGLKWTPDNGELVDVGEFMPLSGEELDRLKEIAGEDAYIYPETQDDFWRCVCGRINPLESSECMRCRRERNYVLKELNRKQISFNDEEIKKRVVRMKRAQHAKEKAPSEQTKIQNSILLIVLSTVVFLSIAILLSVL